MIEFMNSASKLDFQSMEVEDRISMIMMENKVIYKDRYVHSVRNKVEALHKKLKHFKNKFTDLFIIGMPSFWDDKGNVIS